MSAFLAILLFPFPIEGYEPDAKQLVVVAEPLIRVLPSPRHLRDWCGMEGTYDACTRFVAYRLEAICTPAEAGWVLEVSAAFRPWIFLSKLAQLQHEHDHIGDLRRMVEAHAVALQSLSFAAADECRQRALQESAAFGERMRDFATRSNEARHGAAIRAGALGSRPRR